MPLLRVLVPASATDAVVSLLADEPACSSVMVQRGAAVLPEGDVVLCQVGRVAVDAIVEELGAVEGTQVWLEDSEPLIAPDGARFDHADAVMWAQVTDLLGRSTHLTLLFVLLITLSGAIAAVGIISNQLLLIIGAMALSPDYFPLIAGCLAVVRRKRADLVHSAGTLLAGFAFAAVAGWAITEAMLRSGIVDDDLASSGSVVLFIAQPSWLSLVVALLAGVAGALSVTLSDNRALVGVFVSITTIPAAAGIGVGVAVEAWDKMAGSAGQLAVNVVALYAAGSVTLWAQRAYWTRRTPHHAHHVLGGDQRSA